MLLTPENFSLALAREKYPRKFFARACARKIHPKNFARAYARKTVTPWFFRWRLRAKNTPEKFSLALAREKKSLKNFAPASARKKNVFLRVVKRKKADNQTLNYPMVMDIRPRFRRVLAISLRRAALSRFEAFYIFIPDRGHVLALRLANVTHCSIVNVWAVINMTMTSMCVRAKTTPISYNCLRVGL